MPAPFEVVQSMTVRTQTWVCPTTQAIQDVRFRPVRRGGGPGGPESDEPPEVGSIHEATVERVSFARL